MPKPSASFRASITRSTFSLKTTAGKFKPFRMKSSPAQPQHTHRQRNVQMLTYRSAGKIDIAEQEETNSSKTGGSNSHETQRNPQEHLWGLIAPILGIDWRVVAHNYAETQAEREIKGRQVIIDWSSDCSLLTVGRLYHFGLDDYWDVIVKGRLLLRCVLRIDCVVDQGVNIMGFVDEAENGLLLFLCTNLPFCGLDNVAVFDSAAHAALA